MWMDLTAKRLQFFTLVFIPPIIGGGVRNAGAGGSDGTIDVRATGRRRPTAGRFGRPRSGRFGPLVDGVPRPDNADGRSSGWFWSPGDCPTAGRFGRRRRERSAEYSASRRRARDLRAGLRRSGMHRLPRGSRGPRLLGDTADRISTSQGHRRAATMLIRRMRSGSGKRWGQSFPWDQSNSPVLRAPRQDLLGRRDGTGLLRSWMIRLPGGSTTARWSGGLDFGVARTPQGAFGRRGVKSRPRYHSDGRWYTTRGNLPNNIRCRHQNSHLFTVWMLNPF